MSQGKHTVLGVLPGLLCMLLGYAAAFAATLLGVLGGTVPPGFPRFYGEMMLLLLGAAILLLIGMVGLLLARRPLLVLGQVNLAVFVAAVVCVVKYHDEFPDYVGTERWAGIFALLAVWVLLSGAMVVLWRGRPGTLPRGRDFQGPTRADRERKTS